MDKNTEKTTKKKKNITAGPSSTNKKVKLSKEFFCDICQIDFTRKDNLRRHNIKNIVKICIYVFGLINFIC